MVLYCPITIFNYMCVIIIIDHASLNITMNYFDAYTVPSLNQLQTFISNCIS